MEKAEAWNQYMEQRIRSPRKRVAIVYHYLAHYREAVFTVLSRGDARHAYEIFADRISNLQSIATIDPRKSNSVHPGGPLNWRFIRNRWLTPAVLWQGDVVRLAAKDEHDVLILLGNMQFLSTWVAAFLGRLRGKRILMWTHGALRHESGLRGILRKTFYRLAHGLLLYGHRAKEILKAQGFDENKLYVVYNSLDTGEQNRLFNELAPEAIAQARQKSGVAADIPLLISIGRMTPGKDLHLLPLALAELKAAGRRVDLVFVGDGPARPEIEDLVLRHGIGEQVYFMGEIYAEADLCPLISAADICVCPGAVGLTSMHALIYGTPVITHDQPDWQKPEYEAIKAGITGAFFHRGNAQDLARTIETWLATNHDRTVLRNVCRESLLRHYTPENQRFIIEQAVDALPATGIEEIYQHPSAVPDRINALP